MLPNSVRREIRRFAEPVLKCHLMPSRLDEWGGPGRHPVLGSGGQCMVKKSIWENSNDETHVGGGELERDRGRGKLQKDFVKLK